MVQKQLLPLYRQASNRSFESSFDAVWYDGSHCTAESRKKNILSDLITSTYKLVETQETEDLLSALDAAKKSKFMFQRVWADDYTYDEISHCYMKYGIFFSQGKERIQIRCRIQIAPGEFLCTVGSNTKSPKNLITFQHVIASIEHLQRDYILL